MTNSKQNNSNSGQNNSGQRQPNQQQNQQQQPHNGQQRPAGFAVSKSASLDSVESVGGGQFKQDDRAQQPSPPPVLHMLKSATYGDYLFDCCALVITCPKHKAMALSRTDSRKTWLPYLQLSPAETWFSKAKFGINLALTSGDMNQLPLPVSTPRLIHIQRLELPEVHKFVTRVVYEVKLTSDANEKGNWKCCTETNFIQWVQMDDNFYKGNLPFLWGPEPMNFATLIPVKDKNLIIEPLEFSAEDATLFAPHAHRQPHSHNEELLSAALFTVSDVNKLYSDFLQHCYPSFHMTSVSFISYMTKIGWLPTDPTLLPMFRAFCALKQNWLDFHEFLLGIAAMEHATPHSGIVGPMRTKYIFRFYDSNGDGVLEEADVAHMARDIHTIKEDKVPSNETIDKEAKERWQILLKEQKDLKAQAITADVFTNAVGSLKFRGTSVLFRSNFNIIKNINDKKCYENIQNLVNSPSGVNRRRYVGICPSCRPKKYFIAPHALFLDVNGRTIDPIELVTSDPSNFQEIKGLDQTVDALRHYARLMSFNPHSIANHFLSSLRQFDYILGRRSHFPIPNLDKNAIEAAKKQSPRKWALTNPVESIRQLAKEAGDIVAQESRVVKVQSPVYVMGDIHGNLSDLMLMEKNIWSMGPGICGASHLFLGDYVDRGEWSVECACYLMAMKLLAPDRFFLCRGNHEIRSIQKQFTFYKECTKKFGPDKGRDIFEAINDFFDRLPIAAVIDENIFCAHGGIPFSDSKLEALDHIKCPLVEPEFESPSAWEILWNDPMNQKEFESLDALVNRSPAITRGFIANNKRGTAFYYTDEAVDTFLQLNGLTHIIRAHEVKPHGYKFHMNGKVVTIFSSSNYGNSGNKSVCAFVDVDKIRIIRLEC